MTAATSSSSSRNTLTCLGGAAVAAALCLLAPWRLIGHAIEKLFLLIGYALESWRALVGSVVETAPSLAWGVFLFGLFFLACKAYKGSQRAYPALIWWLAVWGLFVGMPSFINAIAHERSVGENAPFVAWLKGDQGRGGAFAESWNNEVQLNGMISRHASKKLCQLRTEASLANATLYTLTIDGKPVTGPEQCGLINEMTWTPRVPE